MGEEAAEPVETRWTILYEGGGPLDGQASVSTGPIVAHVLTLIDPPFEGHQVYEESHRNPDARIIVLGYVGERWGPAFEVSPPDADGSS